MTRSRLNDLAERCEKAREGSREVDAAIARLLHNGDVEWDDGELWWGKHGEPLTKVPCFSESVDAALTLVPRGWTTEAAHEAPRDPQRWKWHLCDVERYRFSAGYGPTPALALCAAALRALASQEPDDEHK